jgi:hypothetical protein
MQPSTPSMKPLNLPGIKKVFGYTGVTHILPFYFEIRTYLDGCEAQVRGAKSTQLACDGVGVAADQLRACVCTSISACVYVCVWACVWHVGVWACALVGTGVVQCVRTCGCIPVCVCVSVRVCVCLRERPKQNAPPAAPAAAAPPNMQIVNAKKNSCLLIY